ncbi:hypothetical protein MKW92_034480, partial [Papaver armeniacum]
MLGEFSVKEPALAAYRDKAQKLIKDFDSVSLAHTGRTSNKHAHALATLASSLQMLFSNEGTITVTKNSMPPTWFEDIIFENENDWGRPILQCLKQQSEDHQVPWKLLSKYKIIDGSLYFITTTGILCKCIGNEEAKKILHEIHERTCGFGLEIPLQRRIQRAGFYWTDMIYLAQKLQDNCTIFQGAPLHEEACCIVSEEDWRTPYIDYLTMRTLPDDKKLAKNLEKRVK